MGVCPGGWVPEVQGRSAVGFCCLIPILQITGLTLTRVKGRIQGHAEQLESYLRKGQSCVIPTCGSFHWHTSHTALMASRVGVMACPPLAFLFSLEARGTWSMPVAGGQLPPWSYWILSEHGLNCV